MGMHELRIGILGSGGDGVMSAATITLRAAADQGLYGMMTQSYGPQIRGGEAAAFMKISDHPVNSEGLDKDVLICFKYKDAERFESEVSLSPRSLVIHEQSDDSPVPEWLKGGSGDVLEIPFLETLKDAGLEPIAKNIMVYGFLTKLLKWDQETSAKYVRKKFAYKGDEVVNSNIKALEIGYNYAAKLKLPFDCEFNTNGKTLTTMTGNVACAKAAVEAGCRFFAGYPITPSSEVMEHLFKIMPGVEGHVVQAEDEIASVGMLVGASFGGAPSMTATSGPGLSLMTEMLGLAAKVEQPIVVLNVQRGGPSTGIPSRTEQSDLYQAVYGGHGDLPRVVLSAANVEECWSTMFRAFYLSEKYQMPAIVLTDGYIGQSAENIPAIDLDKFPKPQRANLPQVHEDGYLRFDTRDDSLPAGVTYLARPGTPGGMHMIGGIEQSRSGRPTTNREIHERMTIKRYEKFDDMNPEVADWFEVFGNPDAKEGIVGWGSTRGVLKDLVEQSDKYKVFIPQIISPFPIEGLSKFMRSVKDLSFVEMNFQGQLYKHVRSEIHLPESVRSLNWVGGRPFCVEEIVERLEGAK